MWQPTPQTIASLKPYETTSKPRKTTRKPLSGPHTPPPIAYC
ncbi:hypothetical protein CORMATOL_00513 [Corynebacterium matruchotii ATCC 33806]|uniref:Uncharacterized protein n=1 Tax=Corynebacterium matruchotii ATCC 33806 TaxID=566549 RepID=C0E0L3_9CORY|nr:hypothetical protein CORMATOL_00513 [Corynebacterium matruchotii ATCC 33806]